MQRLVSFSFLNGEIEGNVYTTASTLRKHGLREMFRCNLTNGRGKTNLFDVEPLLIVNAGVEFSLFLCANNYSRELAATFVVFLPPCSPSLLLVHVLLLHLSSSMFLCAHEKFPSCRNQHDLYFSSLPFPSLPRYRFIYTCF